MAMKACAMNRDPDLIILGSGSTAFAAALRARTYEARVLMVEKSALGGTCINWGCIPSKTLISAAQVRHEFLLGSGIGLDASGFMLDYDRLGRHRDQVVAGKAGRHVDDVANAADVLDALVQKKLYSLGHLVTSSSSVITSH